MIKLDGEKNDLIHMMGQLKTTLLFIVLCIGYTVQAKVKLPAVFSDNMILQQKTNAAFWGQSEPGKTIEIGTSWNARKYSSVADSNGDWKILVATPSYGGPYTINISDGEPLTLKNVLIGEVWLCSGQSNMEMPLAGWGKIKDYQKEISEAKYPNIRLLQAEHVTANRPLKDVKVTGGGWQECSPQSVAEFSSVAYFFAREIYRKKGIPVGLIHTSWGGTIAEAWTSGTTLKTMPYFAEAVNRIERTDQEKVLANSKKAMENWQNTVLAKDAGFEQGRPVWVATGYDDSSWKTMALPALWEGTVLPAFDGVVWFRKKISIPASWAGKDLKINLGTIDDDDITFFDGVKIGETKGFGETRSYTVPAAQVKAGEFVLAVRVFDLTGGGGIYGDKKVMALSSAAGERISLDGDWKYKVGLHLKDIPAVPSGIESPNRPAVLYNSMIHPFIPFAIRGAIWYQGESNSGRANQYRTLFPAMITDWRKKWNIGDFPFYFVQLANYMKTSEQPAASAWAELRDAQLKTLSLPNTGMSVTIDIGEGGDIHPKNKQEVGRRLALIALAKTYSYKTPYSGPLAISQQVKGNSVSVNFKYTDGGLKTKDGAALTGFAVAGADQKFYWADAVIKGNKVVLSSTEVPNPVAVRYAWADNPLCNLYNGAGLPASPFRTDNWKDTTEAKAGK
ncbi:sialate O-acetylesterase [Pedobacter hartonius]|uniref:sialate O-acetylesterase n=1 Tax=Pedobacter hartonius TaxID=425514 RepID=UPI001FDEFB9B|nr:sialate O-acetylesterase [Pedobacter hartonius]